MMKFLFYTGQTISPDILHEHLCHLLKFFYQIFTLKTPFLALISPEIDQILNLMREMNLEWAK